MELERIAKIEALINVKHNLEYKKTSYSRNILYYNDKIKSLEIDLERTENELSSIEDDLVKQDLLISKWTNLKNHSKNFVKFNLGDEYLIKYHRRYTFTKVVKDDVLNVNTIRISKRLLFANEKLDNEIYKNLISNPYSKGVKLFGISYRLDVKKNELVIQEADRYSKYVHHSYVKYINLKDLDIPSIENFKQLAKSKDPETKALFRALCESYLS